MAIFEKKYERKVTLDDTEELSCKIETAQIVKSHTEYVLRVQRGPLKENSWKILRRYDDFYQLNKSLAVSGLELPLPGKRIVGNMRPDFVAERRLALQKYINFVLMNPILASSLPAKRFVDPDTYSTPFLDTALQNASLCLRSESLFSLGATLGAIGWRIRKHYFKVTSKSIRHQLLKSSSQSQQNKHYASSTAVHTAGDATGSGKTELVLAWTEYGPDKYVDDRECHSVFKSLASLEHPHIEPILYAATNDCGALVIRKFHKEGSLKDILCMSTPKNPYLSKYGNPKGRKILSVKQVARYGRQILDALRYLHSKGMPFGHLHSGNILIVDDNVFLLDIENFILGVPAFYRPFFVQHSKIHTAETIDVYCFGHVLFEMSMGYPLQESVTRQIADCPEALKNLLGIILSKEACKSGLPTLDQLAEHRFFAEYSAGGSAGASSSPSKFHFKLSANAKEQICVAAKKSEQRLKDEQKSVKNQKRLVRVQELMSSEEEKKKSKQKAKLEYKQSKLRSQHSIQLSGPVGSSGSNNISFNRTDSVASITQSHDTQSEFPVSSNNSISPLPPPSSPLVLTRESQIVKSESVTADSPEDRSALLNSICRFNRGSLRKVKSND